MLLNLAVLCWKGALSVFRYTCTSEWISYLHLKWFFRHVTAVFLSTQLFYAVCDLATSQVSLFGTGKVTSYFMYFRNRSVFIPKCIVVVILPVTEVVCVFSTQMTTPSVSPKPHYLWTSWLGEASPCALSSRSLLLSHISIPSLTRTPFKGYPSVDTR